jgi:hypothetical protein
MCVANHDWVDHYNCDVIRNDIPLVAVGGTFRVTSVGKQHVACELILNPNIAFAPPNSTQLNGCVDHKCCVLHAVFEHKSPADGSCVNGSLSNVDGTTVTSSDCCLYLVWRDFFFGVTMPSKRDRDEPPRFGPSGTGILFDGSLVLDTITRW